MLYLIAEKLDFPGILNLIRYLSFRAGAASAKTETAAARMVRMESS